MSLWGLTDNLAGAPKWLTPTTSVAPAGFATSSPFHVTIANHSFTSGDQVTLTNSSGTALAGARVGNGIKYVKVINASEIQLFENADLSSDRCEPSGQGVGDHTLQVTPSDVYFIDSTEATLKANQDKGFDAPGWYQYSTYTDVSSSVRHKAELLCAFGDGNATAAGDAGVDATDDAVAFDREITITSVSAPAVDIANDANIVATVVATKSGAAGGTITFQWQKSTDNGANFTNISADSTYTNVTTAVLTVTGANVSDKAGEQYRCVCSLALAQTRTSLPVIATQST